MARHVKKGDVVIINSGKERGRQGTILRVLSERDKVVVEGINVRKKNVRRSQEHPNGGIIEKEMPIHASNVSPVVDGKPSRVRFEVKDGAKVRVAVRNGESLDEAKKGKKKKK